MTYHPPILRFKNLSVDLNSREVLVDNSPLQLTEKEYQVLEYLLRHRGNVISKEMITEYIYGSAVGRNLKIVDIFVWKLRKKLDKAGAEMMIGTAWGRGFIIAAPRDDQSA